MRICSLEDMFRGWFIGSFTPTALVTNQVEVAVKKYKAGEYELPHYHKIGTEVTVIISGKVKMMNRILESGQIIIIEPGEITDFHAITDAVNVVVKIPGVTNDKYTLGNN
jgi:quercetin dioxygenase-like cupin family protein